MKKLSLIDKFFFFVNSLLAVALLLAYSLPFISPKTFPTIAVLSLTVPLLILVNIIFALYWLLKFKKQLLLSVIVLALGFPYLLSLYKFSEKKVLLTNDLKVMSYNVRLFNLYEWSKDKEMNQHIFDFITNKDPDILALQEFHDSKKISFQYPYEFKKTKGKKNKIGQVIYSKYRIINSGSLNFERSGNNAIFADIVKEKDTFRVYNIHLESLKINPRKENFGEQNSEKLLKRFEKTFKKQVSQTEKFIAHQKKCPYKKIITGDFNNTAFSWVYRKIKKGKNDAFDEAGAGFGKTFNYPFPLRIDFILTDKNIVVNNFKTFDVAYSDHFPIMARLQLDGSEK